MRAWVVEEEWAGETESKTIAIFSAREGIRKIATRVETIYWLSEYILAEQKRFSFYIKPTANPYPAEISNGRVVCGHNPFLIARKVELGNR